MNRKSIRVAVGMSGGVDSSVAAALLKNKGYDVIGLTMEIYDGSVSIPEKGKQTCYSPGERINTASAERICKKLGIPFYVIDLKKEFREHVIEYFRNEYLKGRTPNPCIVCNQKLKFGFMLDKARKAGIDFDFFATGHYAEIIRSDKGFMLKKPADSLKDQTYFLYQLSQEQLSGIMFPLKEYSKNEVRRFALDMGLEVLERPESQDFLPNGDHGLFFCSSEIEEGDIVNENGDVLGRHKGIIHYTIGQRRGLGVSFTEPLYVTGIDPIKNRIIVGKRDSVFSIGFFARDVKIADPECLNQLDDIKVKIRLNHKGAHARISFPEDGCMKVIFSEPQPAVTPGQHAVIYVRDIVAGGGIIEGPIDETSAIY